VSRDQRAKGVRGPAPWARRRSAQAGSAAARAPLRAGKRRPRPPRAACGRTSAPSTACGRSGQPGRTPAGRPRWGLVCVWRAPRSQAWHAARVGSRNKHASQSRSLCSAGDCTAQNNAPTAVTSAQHTAWSCAGSGDRAQRARRARRRQSSQRRRWPHHGTVHDVEERQVGQREAAADQERALQQARVDAQQRVLRQRRQLRVPEREPLRDLRARAPPTPEAAHWESALGTEPPLSLGLTAAS
jgi:hypothetical protein